MNETDLRAELAAAAADNRAVKVTIADVKAPGGFREAIGVPYVSVSGQFALRTGKRGRPVVLRAPKVKSVTHL